jgi:penicillin V acylase-like amidase (Ntn superfamily)
MKRDSAQESNQAEWCPRITGAKMYIIMMRGGIMRKRCIIGLIILGLIGVSADIYGCSSVCLDKKGQVILGNNNDWITGDGMVVINKRHVVKRGFWYENRPEWTWTSKYGSITFNFEGREFPIRGVNEAGLAIVELMLSETRHPSSGGLPVLSGSQWFQYQLDNSATVEEVIASDTVVRIEATDWEGMASHYLICDSSGTVAGIEWLDGQLTVYTGDSLPIPAMVNSTYASCITNGDDPSGRFKPIAGLYAAYDTAQTEDGLGYVFSMLQAATMYSPPFQTRWSMAFDVHAMRYYWKTEANDLLRYVDLRDFDFSCGTDVEVLDINSADTGNVRASFVPYTTDFNRDMVTRVYSLYNQYSSYTGTIYTQDTIDAIIAFPESTFCDIGGIRRVSRASMAGGCRVYSDPKSSSIRIVLPEPASTRIAFSLFDTRGRTIASGVEHSAQPNKSWIIWGLPRVSRGLYYCKIITGKNRYIRPIIIQRK